LVPVGELIDMVKEYARQETLGPLKGAGRWIGYGIAGAILISSGVGFLVLGVLRMIQAEWPSTFEGRWMSLLPYLFGLVFCIIVSSIAFSRVNKEPLNKEER
jgi:hypothetical protein